MYLILMVYACLISCSLINKSKCHSLAYFNLRWTCVVILHKIYLACLFVSLIDTNASRGYTLVSEGQEKDDFWEAIGGQKPYSSSPSLMVSWWF